MTTRDHRKAQQLSQQAESDLRAGKIERALRKYSEAAALEEKVLDAVDEGKDRTYSIIAVSAVALWYKAREYEQAQLVAYRALATARLTHSARSELRELLEVIWDEQMMRSHKLAESGEEITVSLRGGQVGAGKAPIGAAVNVQSSLSSLVTRVAENIGGFPYRNKGLPHPGFQNIFQQRLTAARPGSYRFTIHLAGPEQQDLFKEPIISLARVAETVISVVELANRGSLDDLKQVIPNNDYRNGALRLLRSASPDGKTFGELAIFRHAAIESAFPIVCLNSHARHRIERLISDQEDSSGTEIRGTLRAVNLDNNHLRIVQESGDVVQCIAPSGLLDDIVGPLINSSVVARGEWAGRGQQQHFRVNDIHADET